MGAKNRITPTASIIAELKDWKITENGNCVAGGVGLESHFNNVEYEDILYLASLITLQFVNAIPNCEMNEDNVRNFLSDIFTMISGADLIESYRQQMKPKKEKD